MLKAWGKVKAVAVYSGVSERTVEGWLKNGLKCSRLPSGLRLIKFSWVDEYLENFSESSNHVDRLVNEMVAKI